MFVEGGNADKVASPRLIQTGGVDEYLDGIRMALDL
jgi:hypothetical protein